LIITEVLDENNFPVQPGEAGELTVTSLGIEGMPVLRYKTGDIVQLHEGSCSCGRTTARVSPVIGRKQQMIKLKGTTVYPPAIFDIVHQANISDYVVEVFSNQLGTDELRLYLTIEEPLISMVKSIFQSRLRVLPEIVVTSRHEIERMQLSDGTRKPRRFIDRRLD
jgi:phenylacetate-CoA ligase